MLYSYPYTLIKNVPDTVGVGKLNIDVVHSRRYVQPSTTPLLPVTLIHVRRKDSIAFDALLATLNPAIAQS